MHGYFTKCGRVESRTTKSKSKPKVRAGSELRATAFKHNVLTTGPRSLFKLQINKFLKLLEMKWYHANLCLVDGLVFISGEIVLRNAQLMVSARDHLLQFVFLLFAQLSPLLLLLSVDCKNLFLSYLISVSG